jgi:hypothetical protein
MTCPHCRASLPARRIFDRAVDGGRAFAGTCTTCSHVVAIRPRLSGDPPIIPGELSNAEIARLRFVRWRLQAECHAQVQRYLLSDFTPGRRLKVVAFSVVSLMEMEAAVADSRADCA